jgi:hypothetical protein
MMLRWGHKQKKSKVRNLGEQNAEYNVNARHERGTEMAAVRLTVHQLPREYDLCLFFLQRCRRSGLVGGSGLLRACGWSTMGVPRLTFLTKLGRRPVAGAAVRALVHMQSS